MPRLSLRDRLARCKHLLSPERYIDALLEVRGSDGQVLYRVGGLWDSHEKCYVRSSDPLRPVAHVVTLQPSQDQSGRAIARYLKARAANDPGRKALLMFEGNRGGGKTWIGGLLIASIALAQPRSYQQAVSITTKQKRELEEAVKQVAPERWLDGGSTDMRDPFMQFITGAQLLWRTSKAPSAMREANLVIEHVCVNEGQDQPLPVYTNAVGAIRNKGGIVSVLTNPPQVERGDWVANVALSIAAGEIDMYAERYTLAASGNLAIHQATQPKIRALLRAADPAAADADADGIMKLAGPIGYPGFIALPLSKGGHIGGSPRRPDIGAPKWTDVTRELTADAVKGDDGFDTVGGIDFNLTPGCCAPVAKLYRVEWIEDGDPWRPGDIVMAVIDFVTTEGTEEDLSNALVQAGYYPGDLDRERRRVTSCLLIGDATGDRQAPDKGESFSFGRLRGHGWTIIPPDRHWHTGKPYPPRVRDSRSQMHTLFARHQILIAAVCNEPQPGWPSLVESFRKAKVKPDGKFVKKGHFTHGPDGVRYLAWVFLPRPKKRGPGGLDDDTLDEIRGIKVLKNG